MAVKIVNLDEKNGLTPDCLKKEVRQTDSLTPLNARSIVTGNVALSFEKFDFGRYCKNSSGTKLQSGDF